MFACQLDLMHTLNHLCRQFGVHALELINKAETHSLNVRQSTVIICTCYQHGCKTVHVFDAILNVVEYK